MPGQPVQVTPFVDESAADLGSLVELGMAEAPPVPSPDPPAPPDPMTEMVTPDDTA